MKIGILMGSISDREVCEACFKTLEEFGVEYEKRVISAHRSLDLALDYVNSMDEKNIALTICFAGKAAHLAGVIAGVSTKPVIGVPVKSSTLDGLDALLSTVQMPSGVPVATVAINGAKNAALLAIQILAINDEKLKEKLKEYKIQMKENVKNMDKELNS